MNRRARRQQEQALGITKFRKELKFGDQREAIRNNMEAGQQLHAQNTEQAKLNIDRTDSEAYDARIRTGAEFMVDHMGISMLDAIKLAKEQVNKTHKK